MRRGRVDAQDAAHDPDGPDQAASGDEMDPEAGIAWTSHPIRHRPWTGLGLTLFVFLLIIGVQASFHDPLMTVLSAIVLALSLTPFYLPTYYRLTQDDVSIRTPFRSRKKSWDIFRRWEADRRGVLISPFDSPSRLDRLHGLNLMIDAPDRDRVLDYLRQRLDGHDGTP